MIPSSIKHAFEDICGIENVLDEIDLISGYSTDETPDLKNIPLLVIRPNSTLEISKIVKICYENNISITTRGGGTSVVGGSVPSENAIVISLERMNRILEMDSETMTAVVQPAVITKHISDKAEEFNLFYPVDPASHESCSIGGNIATSAGGLQAVKYGVTKDYVMGITAVTGTGDIIKHGGKIKKNASGYNITGLLIGSEGTLAIITEIVLKLKPKPKYRTSLLVAFNSLADASTATTLVLQKGFNPCSIEFYDKDIIDIIQETSGKEVPLNNAGAHLVLQFDSQDENELEKEYMECGEFLFEIGAEDIMVANQRPLQEKLWGIRRGIREAVRTISPTIVAEDVAVPINKISTLVENINRIAEKWDIRIVTFGHAGDGNAHIDILKESMPDEKWNDIVHKIIEEIAKVAIDLGGTISGEHGIGIIKNELLHIQYSESELQLMHNIKKAFDPQNILNPGKALV